ncbi:MAG: D-2-hydroxyacid dehydrogenase [Clostridia bacterium]|nr:D-2-hydroxyacid dehydrogenase [Clostridia bacterium]
MKIVVLDGFAVNPGDLSWDFLEKYGDVTVYDKTPDAQVAEVIGDAEIVFTNRCKVNAAVLDACPNVRYVSALGTGYDMIDTEACRERGVCVCNVPAYSSDSVAQLTMTLLLTLTTDMNGLRGIVHDGKWTGVPGFAYQVIPYTELAGMTIGLLGCGGIGKRVAEMAAAFKMKVLASTRSRQSGNDGVIEYLPLDEMLARCDVLSLHCPLSDATRGMVDSDFIAKMKPGALLLNTARGAILNEADVAAALNDGRLGGAGLDVLANEPALPDNPLLTAKNCVITPHVAWTTMAARKRLLAVLDANLGSFVATGRGINQIV